MLARKQSAPIEQRGLGRRLDVSVVVIGGRRCDSIGRDSLGGQEHGHHYVDGHERIGCSIMDLRGQRTVRSGMRDVQALDQRWRDVQVLDQRWRGVQALDQRWRDVQVLG